MVQEMCCFLCPVFLFRASFTLFYFPYKTGRLVPHSSYVLSDLPRQVADSLGQNLPLTMCLTWVYYLLGVVIKDKTTNPTSFLVYLKR